MDYSLLVGIHDCAQAEEEALHNESLARDAAAGGRETSESEECESGERFVHNLFICSCLTSFVSSTHIQMGI